MKQIANTHRHTELKQGNKQNEHITISIAILYNDVFFCRKSVVHEGNILQLLIQNISLFAWSFFLKKNNVQFTQIYLGS